MFKKPKWKQKEVILEFNFVRPFKVFSSLSRASSQPVWFLHKHNDIFLVYFALNELMLMLMFACFSDDCNSKFPNELSCDTLALTCVCWYRPLWIPVPRVLCTDLCHPWVQYCLLDPWTRYFLWCLEIRWHLLDLVNQLNPLFPCCPPHRSHPAANITIFSIQQRIKYRIKDWNHSGFII